LEPGIPPLILAELANRNIRCIYVHWGDSDQEKYIYFADDLWNLRKAETGAGGRKP
jgi:hypothetical protein